MAELNTTLEQQGSTAGDRSNAAATAGAETTDSLSIMAINFGSPQGRAPGLEIVGDQVALTKDGSLQIVDLVEPPENSYGVYKLSAYLAPVLAAINTNVYAADWAFKPVIDLTQASAKGQISSNLLYEQALKAGDFEAGKEPSKEEIEKEFERLKRRQNNEGHFIKAWLERCCPGMGYRVLRTLVGLDMEINGSGYMEVTRDVSGHPARLLWAPAWSIRATPSEQVLVPVLEPAPVSDLHWGLEWQLRRFRRFVQLDYNSGIVARFKEYGDPRVMSRSTGKYYLTLEDLMANTDDEWGRDSQDNPIAPQPATELLQFSLQTPVNTTYGKPEYTGSYPVLTGTRALEEENQTLITDQKIPQMFCLVAGAAGISDKNLTNLEKKIEEKKAQGKRSIYFIQAKSTKMANGMLSATPTLELIKTKSEQHVDMLGLQYQAHGAKLSRLAYRLPRAELGDDEGYSREQQLAAHRFAESQVYSPRRDLFDDRTNSTLLRDLGVQTGQMRTRSRTPTDPDQLSEIVSRLITAGVLTPDEAREIASDIFGRDFEDLLGVWSKLPPPLLTALLQTKNQLIAAALMSSEDNADVLNKLREAFSTQTGVTDATHPGQVPVPQGGTLLEGKGGNGTSDGNPEPEEV